MTCCIEEYNTCGAEIECDPGANFKFVLVFAGVFVFMMSVVAYLLIVQTFSSRSYLHRMSQIILQKQYHKMKQQKSKAIVIG